MKRKTYFHFAWSRIAVGLLVGALVFTVITVSLEDTFSAAMDACFEKREEFFERILKS